MKKVNGKVAPSLIKHHVMKMYGRVEAYLYEFLNSALEEGV
jgi:hypothetical protein